jgi:hypothetical protein
MTLFFNAHHVTLLNLKRGDIHLTAVDLDVSVIDKLPGLSTRSREAGTVDDIVQATFEHEQKILARDTFLTTRLFEIVSELFFKNEVDAFDLLFLTQLLTVTGKHLSAGRTVLSGRVGTSFFDRT